MRLNRFLVVPFVFALCTPAEAQQAKKLPLIGILYPGLSGAFAPQLEGFQQGLRQLGYTEGKNVAIEYRFAEEKLDPCLNSPRNWSGSRLTLLWPLGVRRRF
jgi:hypothetical protein